VSRISGEKHMEINLQGVGILIERNSATTHPVNLIFNLFSIV